MEEEYMHTNRGGIKIRLKDLATFHMQNIIKVFEKMAKKGVKVKDPDGTERILHDEEALKHLHYYDYVKALKRREEFE